MSGLSLASLTHPHHKFGVTPDGQGLAKLERERKAGLHKCLGMQNSVLGAQLVLPGLCFHPPPSKELPNLSVLSSLFTQ